MSHRATNWAVEQRGIRPIAKVILWHLADRHNPDNGCFPDQATLARDCEVSRASVNRHLTELEEAGLIRREQRTDGTTGRQLPTRYRLAFEEGFEPLHLVPRVASVDTENEADRVAENGTSVSQESIDPCVTAETPIEPVIGTGNPNQEKNARVREDLTEGLVVVAGKIRLNIDHPLFREIVRLDRNHPPVDRRGNWLFEPATVERARQSLDQARAQAVH